MEQLPIMTASASKTQWAKPEDWDRYQNTITALFMCHSLPVVMRVMRDEHQFHATPKMFQTQIYQKWGLRKTKPGEAKREAKARKRRREESEDVESIASSSQSRGQGTAETVSTSGRSIDSTSQSGTTSWQARSDDPHPVPTTLNQQTTVSAEAESSHPVGDLEGSNSFMTALDSQALIPMAWAEFLGKLNQGQIALPQPTDNPNLPTSIISESHIDNEISFSADGTALPMSDSGSWISTVMLPTPPSSMVTSNPQTTLPDESCSSHSSGQSRTSHTSSREEPESSASGSKRSRTMAAFTRPMGSLRHLEAPAALLIPERSMFFARHYISKTFSTGLWALAQSTDLSIFDTECGKLERWFNDFNPAFDLLREKKVKRAFRLLKKNFANTKSIIKPQDPRVGIYVCQQAIRIMFYDRIGRNLSQTLLKYIAGLCLVLFGPQHPLHVMLDQLARMDSFEFAQNIRPFLDCYFDHLEPFLEPSNNAFGQLTELRGLTVSLMEGTGMMGIYEAKPAMDALVQKAQYHGLPTLHLRVETAAVLQRNRFFSEALSLLADVRESEDAQLNPYEFVYAGIVLMVTLRKMKDSDGAIRIGYEYLEYLSRPLSCYPGYPDNMSMSLRQYVASRESSLLLILVKLEMDLRDSGRIEEADKIQARLDSGVAKEYGVEEVGEDPEAEVGALGMNS